MSDAESQGLNLDSTLGCHWYWNWARRTLGHWPHFFSLRLIPPQFLFTHHCKVTKCRHSPIPWWWIVTNSKYLQLTTMESCQFLLHGILETKFRLFHDQVQWVYPFKMFRNVFLQTPVLSSSCSCHRLDQRSYHEIEMLGGGRIFFHISRTVQLGFNSIHWSYNAKS